MFLIIKINAKVLTPLQTNTNPTTTTSTFPRQQIAVRIMLEVLSQILQPVNLSLIFALR